MKFSQGTIKTLKKGLKCTGPQQAAAIDLASNNTEQKEEKNRGTQRTPVLASEFFSRPRT